MNIARSAQKIYPYKVSNHKVLNKINWLPIEKLINMRVVNFFHNLILNKKPGDIYSTIVLPNRASKDYSLRTNCKINNIFSSFINSYNKMPGEFRKLNRKGFKIKSKKYIQNMR